MTDNKLKILIALQPKIKEAMGKWEKFNLWTYSLNRPSISNTAWLFYDAERFCVLVAQCKVEGWV